MHLKAFLFLLPVFRYWRFWTWNTFLIPAIITATSEWTCNWNYPSSNETKSPSTALSNGRYMDLSITSRNLPLMEALRRPAEELLS